MPGTTSNNGTIVTGYVNYYNPDKQFGFANVNGQDVFFHLSACREVEGTPEEPVITDRPLDREPSWTRRSRHLVHLVLRIVPGQKGPKAAAWGYLPKRTWLENLHHRNFLAGYADGYVEIIYSRRSYGQSYRKVLGCFTAPPELTPGDPWTLRLRYYQHDYAIIEGDVLGEEETTFHLAGASPRTNMPYGRYEMEVPIMGPDGEAWARLVFYPEHPYHRH